MSRVLVAEPDAALRQVLLRVLPRLGYTVDLAGHRSGLEQATTRRYDVVLVDDTVLANAPHVVGLGCSATPRLVVTGWNPTARPRFTFAGTQSDAYIRKPYDIADLLAVLGPANVADQAPSTEAVYLARSKLAVAVHEDGPTPFLRVRSTVDPRQSYLFALREEVLCGGVSLHSRLGWIHAVYWALAYGAGPLPQRATVQFEPSAGRPESSVMVVPRMLNDRWWVADAEGSFVAAGIRTSEAELGRTTLSDRW